MSTALNLQDLTYAGEAASYMLLRPVAEASTVKEGLISIQETKKQFHFPRLEVSNFLQKDSPTPTNGGTILVDGNTITLNTFQIYLEFDPQQFSQHWFANELQTQILDRSLPQTMENFLMRHLMAKNNLKIDNLIWRGREEYDPTSPSYVTPASKGDTGTDESAADLYYFNGLIKQALDDANTIQIGTPVALTTANVLEKLQLVYDKVPKGVLYKFGAYGMKFLVSFRTMQLIEYAYNVSATTAPYKNGNFYDPATRAYLGYTIVPVAGFPDNTIVASLASPDYSATNTFLVVNSTDDTSTVKMSPKLNYSDIWFLRAKMKMNCGWGFTDQLVLYTTLVA